MTRSLVCALQGPGGGHGTFLRMLGWVASGLHLGEPDRGTRLRKDIPLAGRQGCYAPGGWLVAAVGVEGWRGFDARIFRMAIDGCGAIERQARG